MYFESIFPLHQRKIDAFRHEQLFLEKGLFTIQISFLPTNKWNIFIDYV